MRKDALHFLKLAQQQGILGKKPTLQTITVVAHLRTEKHRKARRVIMKVKTKPKQSTP